MQKQNEFSHDPRNAQAAKRLRELASQLCISDDAWALLEPHFNGADARWLAAVTETNRDVGFRKHPRDFAAWLEIGLLSSRERIAHLGGAGDPALRNFNPAYVSLGSGTAAEAPRESFPVHP
jgi:hypothetical protein